MLALEASWALLVLQVRYRRQICHEAALPCWSGESFPGVGAF